MKSIAKLFIAGILFLTLSPAYGQHIPLFNQYYAQPALTYSSASVIGENAQLSLIYRGQLSGLDGAPVTFGLNYTNPLWNEWGYSININSHELGILKQTSISAGLSKMLLKKGHQLALGAEVGTALFSIDESRVSIESLTDELIQNILGNNGSSLFLSASLSYRRKDFTAHIALPNLIQKSLSAEGFDELSRANRTDFSASVGYTIDIAPANNIRFSPQITWRQYRVIGGAIDFTGRLEIKDKFQITTGYREGFGSTTGIGLQIKPGLLFTYQYDFGNSDVPFLSDGFNELGLHLSFKSKKGLDTNLFEAGEAVINKLKEEEIYDKKLISEEDQSAAIGYLGSMESGGRKVREKKGKEAFDKVLDEIKVKGLARMQADADRRRADAERKAADERAEQERTENELALEKAAKEKAKLEAEAARLKEEAEKNASLVPVNPEEAFDGDYIVVVGAFLPDSPNAKRLYENLAKEYTQAGIFKSKVRGYDYVYVMHFKERSQAISAMRELRKNVQFNDSWVHVLRLSK